MGIRAFLLLPLAVFGGGAWLVGVPVSAAWVVLLVMALLVAVVGAAVVWVWAARPRLTSGEQWTVSAVVHGERRRAVSRALCRGDPLAP